MSYDDLTRKHLENLKQRIEQEMQSKGLVNTGDASASLEIQENKLLGNDYIYYLVNGRRPGKFPPVQVMTDYAKEKLGAENPKAVGFLVGRKIATEGTEIHKNPSNGLQLDKLVDDMMNELLKELPETAAAEALKFL